jgi:hypothetical protein
MKCYITFKDNKGLEHTIPFMIYKTDLAKRWVVGVMYNQRLGDKYIHSAFINQTYTDISKIQQQLNSVAEKINEDYDLVLPVFVDIDILDETTLNEMHRQYEVYGTRVDEGLIPNNSLHDNFLLLNELIHTYEEILHSEDSPVPPMSVLVDYYPQTEFYPILERDKLHLTTQFMWGGVYLGYNTLGKDWLNVAHDNDIDVVKRGMVKPQSRFSAETWINFGPDDKDNYNIEAFENWYLTLPKDLQSLVPIDDLHKLSLGRFQIGQVVINDRYFLKYHPNEQDWLSYNHPIKRQWNNEVFSTFTEIIEIRYGSNN